MSLRRTLGWALVGPTLLASLLVSGTAWGQAGRNWDVLVLPGVEAVQRRELDAAAARIGSESRHALRLQLNTTTGNPAEALRAVRNGKSQLALLPLAAFDGNPREFGVFDALFVFKDLEAVSRYQASVETRKLFDALRPQNLVGLAFIHGGMTQLVARKPIPQLEDFRGLKVGVSPQPASLVPQFRALGAAPQAIVSNERVTALEQGVVDVAEFGWSTINRPNFLKLGGLHVIATNHRYAGNVLVANRGAFEQLAAPLQQLVRQEIGRAAEAVNREALARERPPGAMKVRQVGRADYQVLLPKLKSLAWSAPLAADVSRLLPAALAASDLAVARSVFPHAAVPAPETPPVVAQLPAPQAPPPAPQQPAPQQPAPQQHPPQQPPPQQPPPQQPTPQQPTPQQPAPQQPAPQWPAPPLPAPKPQAPQQPSPPPVQQQEPGAPVRQQERGAPVQRIAADVLWNSWVQRDIKPPAPAEVVQWLEPQRDYVVRLDLSRYGYEPNYSAAAGTATIKVVKEALKNKVTTLRLKVRHRLIGASIERPEGARAEGTLQVDVTRLVEPSEKDRTEESALLASFADRSRAQPRLSERLGAGAIGLRVRSTSITGCAQVVFSIWDESGLRPLDHVVHTVSVRGREDAPLDCERGPRLHGGQASLSALLTTGSAVQADAALHLIEVPRADHFDTIGLYVDARQYRAALADPKETDDGLYSWQLPHAFALQDLVGDKHKLLDLIVGARARASYRTAASSLFTNLFGGIDDDARRNAQKAVRSLARLAQGARAPVVLVRAATAREVPVYIPLALLGARDANLLKGRLTVVQPLQRERYSANCIDRWTLGIPRVIDPAVKVGALGAIPPRATRLDNIDALKNYFGTSSVIEQFQKGGEAASHPAQPQRAEAIVLLAHQAGGNLWFTGGGEVARVEPVDHLREFAPGSVAFLASCSVLNPKGDNQQVLEALNRQGIDTVIASPFPIETSVGVALTRAFVAAAGDAYARGETPTVSELFDRAMAAAIKELGPQAPPGDKALEFIIIGNHQMPLCGK